MCWSDRYIILYRGAIVPHWHQNWSSRRFDFTRYSEGIRVVLSSPVRSIIATSYHRVCILRLELGRGASLAHTINRRVPLSSQSLNDFLLVWNNLGVLRYNFLQGLDTIMWLLQTHGNFTVASGAGHWHIWTAFFQMSLKFITSAENFRVRIDGVAASEWTRYLYTLAILKLMLDDFLVGHGFLIAAHLALEKEWV